MRSPYLGIILYTMLQLSKNQAINTIAFYPDTPVTASATGVRLSGSQDYDRNLSTVDGAIISDSANTPWVVAQISGSVIPNASGFYTYHVYELIPTGQPLIWDQTTTQWQLETALWNQGGLIPGIQPLTTLRAFVSGSDVPEFTQYVSPDENGAYTTYLG